MISETCPKKFGKIFKMLVFFDFFKNTTIISKNALDALCSVALSKMAYEEGERDLVIMRHTFGFETPEGKKELHSSMVGVGDFVGSDGNSFMCKTVGIPVAIAARLILNGHTEETGVLSPKTKYWYEPILKSLDEDFGIVVSEEWQ